jgi:ribosomal silencing factor RsfS
MQPAARSFYDLERLWSGEPELAAPEDYSSEVWN